MCHLESCRHVNNVTSIDMCRADQLIVGAIVDGSLCDHRRTPMDPVASISVGRPIAVSAQHLGSVAVQCGAVSAASSAKRVAVIIALQLLYSLARNGPHQGCNDLQLSEGSTAGMRSEKVKQGMGSPMSPSPSSLVLSSLWPSCCRQ